VNWVYKFDGRALKELKKLGPQAQQEIIRFLSQLAQREHFEVASSRIIS
jgi:hypothetical protein